MPARYEYLFQCAGCGTIFQIIEKGPPLGGWVRASFTSRDQVEPTPRLLPISPQGHAYLIHRGYKTQVCIEHTACGYNGDALAACETFLGRPPETTLRFLCLGCLKPFSKTLATLSPGMEVLLTLYGTYTAPIMIVFFTAPTEGTMVVRRARDGSYEVVLFHEKCGYKGPAKIVP